MKRLLFSLLLLPTLAYAEFGSFLLDQPFLATNAPAAAESPPLGFSDRLAFRLTATNLSSGIVSSWPDMVFGAIYTNGGSNRPEKIGTGVYFSSTDNQYLTSYLVPVFTPTSDAANDYAVYCIFKVTNAPSGPYYGLWGVSFGVGVSVLSNLEVGYSAEYVYGLTVTNQINCFVANNGYYVTNRGRWMNNVTNSNADAYDSGLNILFQCQHVGWMDGAAHFLEGYLYEIGVYTNRTLTATDAQTIWDYANSTF